MARNVFVCTVHIGSEPFWASVQPKFVRQHLEGATLVAAVDYEIGDDVDFDHMEIMEGEPKDKLDALAGRVSDRLATEDDDVLVFLDGDAFPVRPLRLFIDEALQAVPLAAVCREEIARRGLPTPELLRDDRRLLEGARGELAAVTRSRGPEERPRLPAAGPTP